MSIFNPKLVEGLKTGNYECTQCGALMEFEDEWRDTLVCPSCGYSTDLDHYGFTDEEFEEAYPILDGTGDEGDGEFYDEAYDEPD